MTDRPDVAALAEALSTTGEEEAGWPGYREVAKATIAALPEGWHLTNDTGQIAALRAALAEVEFVYVGDVYGRTEHGCPVCQVGTGYKHHANCTLNNALANTAEAARAYDEALVKPWREKLTALVDVKEYDIPTSEGDAVVYAVALDALDAARALLERKP